MMMKWLKYGWAGWLCAALCAATGCIGLNRESPEIGTYMLEAVRPEAGSHSVVAGQLMVDSVVVLPPYDAQSLVIREDDVTFESSYYNRLILSPAENFRNNLYQWFDDSGLFREVVMDDQSGSSYRMIATVRAFYADRQSEAVVLSMKVSVVDQRNRSARRILCSLDFEERISIMEFTAEGLIRAYNEALTKTLKACEEDVAMALNINK